MKQLSLIILLTLFSAPAMAYVGPGLGLGVIGTIFGVVAAVVLALFGLFWYPLKRAFKKRKGNVETQQPIPASTENPQTTSLNTPLAQFEKPEDAAHPDGQAGRQTAAAANASEAAISNRTDSPVQ